MGTEAYIVRSIPLDQLVSLSDHIVAVRVEGVKFVDRSGQNVNDPNATTGKNRENTVTLTLEVLRNGVLKTNAGEFPKFFEFGLYWISDEKLDDWKGKYLNNKYIFHLEGDPFKPAHLGDFMQPYSRKSEIKKILKKTPNKKRNEMDGSVEPPIR